MAGLTGSAGGGGFDYVQNSKPADPSDSESWVDTSDPARPVYVYSADRAEFIPTYENVPLFVTQEAISFGESEVTTTLTDTVVSGGSINIDNSTSESNSWSFGSSGSYTRTEDVPKWDPDQEMQSVDVTISGGSSGVTAVKLRDFTNATNLDSVSSPSTGSTYTLSGTMNPGTTYGLRVEIGGSVEYGYGKVPSYTGLTVSNSDAWGVSGLTANYTNPYTTSGTAIVGYTSIPNDIQAWDRLTWEFHDNQGSTTFDVETNDGTGWATYASGVLPPVSIADIATGTDVRIKASFSRSSGADTSPALTYVGRRAER